MESIRSRAREHLPSVLLTLLSIVQAFALESLWDHMLSRPELFKASWTASLGWIQISTSLLLIILIWLVYVGMVMRFRWTPSIGDLTLPFVVGLSELLLIEVMGQEKLGVWFMVLALIYAMLNLFSQSVFRRARHDPDNTEFFSHIEPATRRDHITRGVAVLVVFLIGVWLSVSGDNMWLASSALLTAFVMTAYQIRVMASFWQISMGEP